MRSFPDRRRGSRLRDRDRDDDGDLDGLRRLPPRLRGGDGDRLMELECLRLLGDRERRLASESEPLEGDDVFLRRTLRDL